MKKRRLFSLFLSFALLLPLFSLTSADAYEDFTLDAKAGLLIEADTGEILYEKNAHQENYPASLTKVALTVYENNKKIHSDFGEMLFTHFGVSGPLILSASAHMRHFDKKQYRLEIDLKPALDEQQLDKRLLSDFEKRANSDYCNVLGALLPQKIIDEFIDRSGIPPHEKVHDITRAQRETIRTLLKRWTVNVSAPMPVENAIITSGGVKVGEIDPKTMASKKVPGLYFAGEIIDVDAYTGGFNLQIAWATGKTAGEAAAEYLTEQ